MADDTGGQDVTSSTAFGLALVIGLVATWITAYIIGHGYDPIHDEKALEYVVTKHYWDLLMAFGITALIVYFITLLCGPIYYNPSESSGGCNCNEEPGIFASGFCPIHGHIHRDTEDNG